MRFEYLIGLGNPGPDYVFTRHNAGFLFLDYLCEKLGCSEWKDLGVYTISSVKIAGERMFLIKPNTFMNLSGVAVSELMERGASNEDMLLVYDDVSIPLGKLRIRKSGSAGGHNGVRSVLSVLGTEEVARIRIGIGPKPNGVSLKDYVLSEFDEDELRTLYAVFDVAIEALEVIIRDGIDRAMSIYNSSEVVR